MPETDDIVMFLWSQKMARATLKSLRRNFQSCGMNLQKLEKNVMSTSRDGSEQKPIS